MAVSKPIRFFGVALLLGLLLVTLVQFRAAAQTPDPELIEQGARLYLDNCAVCHGAQGQGRVGATLAKNWPSIRPELTVRTIIAQGVPGSVMPAWGEQYGGPLSDQQIEALVAYILSWQTGGAPDLAPRPTYTARPPISPVPEVEGDPNAGAVLFADNCALCHGPDGEGRIGAPLAKDWPSIRPDLDVRAIISQGVPGSVMPAWSQANGGPLSDQEINHLTAFVLSRPASTVQQVTPVSEPVPDRALNPWLTGWGGVLLFFGVMVVVVALAIIVQRRSS